MGPREADQQCRYDWYDWVYFWDGRTCCPLTAGEIAITNEVEAWKRREFDDAINQKLGDLFSLPNTAKRRQTCSIGDGCNPQDDTFDPNFGMEEDTDVMPEADCIDATGNPLLQQSVTAVLFTPKSCSHTGRICRWQKFLGAHLIRKEETLVILMTIPYSIR